MKYILNHINGLLKNEKVENGLYIVATPIGNLGDITLRSLYILSNVDLIICEDTRVSKKITNKYGIKTTLKPFHKFNSKKLTPIIIEKLQTGMSIALISDSGTPIISDPGADIVKECEINKIRVFSVPGPSAPIASLVYSNFAKSSFLFRGFFPRYKKNIQKEMDLIQKSDCPVIFFESPRRIINTLQIILENHGDCKITFTREITKKNEEFINCNINDLIEFLKKRKKILGEITFIIEPIIKNHEEKISNEEILDLSVKLMEEGLNLSEISKIISKDLNVSKRKIYQLLIKK